jgi:hypothetical protein
MIMPLFLSMLKKHSSLDNVGALQAAIHNLLDKKIMQGNLLKDYQFQKKFGHFVFTFPYGLMFH